MNIDTGKIITNEEYESLTPEQQSRHVPLTEEQAQKLQSVEPKKRVGMYENERRYKEKQLAKRRAASKRSSKDRVARARKARK